MAGIKIKPQQIRWISLGMAVLSALPFSLGFFTGIYLWLSPLILLNSAFASRTLALLNVLGIAVLTAAFLKDRWFCRYLCPTGLLCDMASKCAGRTANRIKVPQVNKALAVASLLISLFGIPVLAILDPINAFYNFFNILHPGFSIFLLINISGLLFILSLNILSPGSWCGRVCPLGGLQMLLTNARNLLKKFPKGSTAHIPERRHLVTGLIGGGLGLAFLYHIRPTEADPLFRPPGSLPGDRMELVCIRCGNCIKACPTKIIKPSLNSTGLTGLMIPELDFNLSYCLPECTACGDVCPSGAITGFNEEQKKHLFIGTAKINLNQCLITNNKECNQCKLACAYDAIEITSRGNRLTAAPEVITNRCVGCAACKIVCPPGAIHISSLAGI